MVSRPEGGNTLLVCVLYFLEMTALYRGLTTKPEFFTPQLSNEWAKYHEHTRKFRTREGMNWAGYAKMYGAEEMNRFWHLEALRRDQVFSNQREVAERRAGEDGFLITLNLTEAEAVKLEDNTDSMQNVHGIPSVNCKITALELYRFYQEGKIVVSSLKERRGQGVEGKA